MILSFNPNVLKSIGGVNLRARRLTDTNWDEGERREASGANKNPRLFIAGVF
jgi:hypothetical protein